VEGHCHLMEGAFWRHSYCGFFERMDPGGTVWLGVGSIDAVIARLQTAQAALADPAAALVGWGFDPIHYGSRRLVRADLDRVSAARPVVLAHASGHILNANSAALERVGLLRTGIEHAGIELGADGLPTGELKGPDAMAAVAASVGLDRAVLAADEPAVREFARLCVRTGVTTATDLASPLPDEAVELLLSLTGQPGFPVRIVPLLRLLAQPVSETIRRAAALRERSTDQLRLGRVKIVADGSIQGFSARLRWPGYYNGAPNGLWYVAPETVLRAYREALHANVQIHTHTNGDEATDLALDCMEQALRETAGPDHRFTLQHCQLADAAQFRRIKALGMAVNLFANHHYFWGDQHRTMTVGPDRAERMNACATALATGVPFSIHSDAPVTPLSPLFTAWCAVNRRTASGHLQGGHERIAVGDALRAITIGAAYTLHLDGEVGSIETGKRADFAVLDDDPYEVAPDSLKDVRVWGTVQGGRVFAAADA
ncbi:MAG TPA: amidohydrolase, partial [Burkholderiaceae bacterium]|nr:amidohydrolase [Burkholderiaceae bacterium]